ncbi:MAG: RNA polymerase sigma factor [Spirochaetales bacterium]|nr:RNA polymerase sigma factor [Spirochaetales bacterium]
MNCNTDNEIEKIWKMVYNLSLNFLHDETLAEDATQEIFAKANSAKESFRHESSLGTWIYRIAYNYLVDQKKKKSKEQISFELFEQDVNNYSPFENEMGLSKDEMKIYVEQVKIGCTKAMLQCLSPEERFAFILGNIFDFSSKDGAVICGTTEEAYRQRLSRASRKIKNFMKLNCGLLSPDATCQCRKRIGVALERERINPDMLLHHTESTSIRNYLASMNEIDEAAEAFRSNPFINKPAKIDKPLKEKLNQLAEAGCSLSI